LLVASAFALLATAVAAQSPETTFWSGSWERPIPASLGAQACTAEALARVSVKPKTEVFDCVAFAEETQADQFITSMEARLVSDGWRPYRAKEDSKVDLRIFKMTNSPDCLHVVFLSPGRGSKIWTGFVVKECLGDKAQ
jgi:hypothetical protein